MIQITSESPDSLNRVFVGDEGRLGYSPNYGLLSESSLESKLRLRQKKALGLLNGDKLEFSFDLKDGTIANCDNCTSNQDTDTGRWTIASPIGLLFVQPISEFEVPVLTTTLEQKAPVKSFWAVALGLVATVFILGRLLAPTVIDEAKTDEMLEKIVEVEKVKEEKQVKITVPVDKIRMTYNKAQQTAQSAQPNQANSMAKSKGFSGLVGSPLLKKVLGGAPLVPNASPGAGAGGLEGSGGQTLTGLGKGLRPTTVGNTGLAGLGGVGTHGKGGGGGGYGTEFVGQGNGKGGAPSLSTVSLSEGVTLDGGLDKGAISSTVVKHLSEVRACYEKELANRPGLSGQVHIYFEIGSAGQVIQTRVDKTSLNEPIVEQCIAGRLKTWNFPKPVGAVVVKVTYPFLLRPVKM